jgi:integrase
VAGEHPPPGCLEPYRPGCLEPYRRRLLTSATRLPEGDAGAAVARSRLPKDGPLFPGITPDRFGSRAGNGTKTIGRWIRERVRIIDPRKAPNHSWRHYFKSVCRDADIKEEHHDALTGHKGQGGEGRDYGEYYVRKLYREICKIKNPV